MFEQRIALPAGDFTVLEAPAPLERSSSETMSGEGLPRRRISGLKTGQSTPHDQDQGFGLEDFPSIPALDLSISSTAEKIEAEEEESRRFTWKFAGIIVIGIVCVVAYTSTWSQSLSFHYGIGGEDLTVHHRALKDAGITHYELVPDIATTNEHVGRALREVGALEISLTLSVIDVEHQLHLERADDLFSTDYQHILLDADGKERVDETGSSQNCVYKARIAGDKHSFGSVSLCDGKMEAMLFHQSRPEREFVVSPLSEKFHVAYRHLAGRRMLRPCPSITDLPKSRVLGEGEWQPTGKRNKTIKLMVVNDVKRFRRLGSRTSTNSIAIMAAVNSFYASLYSETMYGLKFVMLPQVTFVERDGWSVATNPAGEVDSQNLLDRFYEWKRQAKTRNADLVHLYSGSIFKDGFVGRSAQAGSAPEGVCTDRNIGVCQTAGFDMALYAKIAAHELGHSLSMIHDNQYDDPKCNSNSNTFMWSGISLDDGTKFSPCSIITARNFLDGVAAFPYKGCLEDDGPVKQNGQQQIG